MKQVIDTYGGAMRDRTADLLNANHRIYCRNSLVNALLQLFNHSALCLVAADDCLIIPNNHPPLSTQIRHKNSLPKKAGAA